MGNQLGVTIIGIKTAAASCEGIEYARSAVVL